MGKSEEEDFDCALIVLLIIAFMDSMCACYSLEQNKRIRARNRILQRQSFDNIADNMTSEEFRRVFRLTKRALGLLSNELEPQLKMNDEIGKRSSTVSLSVHMHVAIFLHSLTGSYYHDLISSLCIARPTVYKAVYDFVPQY